MTPRQAINRDTSLLFSIVLGLEGAVNALQRDADKAQHQEVRDDMRAVAQEISDILHDTGNIRMDWLKEQEAELDGVEEREHERVEREEVQS